MDEIKDKVLTAPEIDNYRYCLNNSNKRFTMESLEPLPALFAELKKIAPCNENGLRVLYCEAERDSIEDYGDFEDKLANEDVKNREEFEELWREEYPSETKWFELRALEENGYMAIWLEQLMEEQKEKLDAAGMRETAIELFPLKKQLQEWNESVAAVQDIFTAFEDIHTLWEELFPLEKEELIRLLIQKIEVRADGLDIEFKADGINSLVSELTVLEAI